ncbi:unnamed protein product [Parnassius apollo]|uniref:(apollo) hypothetical protein n=1 Tax=Parnassius apollo TaxID=110799 RepID=A0A8S3XBF7_PARAO|nr:unnamed protein product [Parnassius apollo]
MDFIFLWLVTFVLGFWIFKKLKEWQSLPPGPWGLPIVGFLPFIDRHQPHLTLTELAKEYGSIYGIGMGSIYAVVLSDHKLVREAFAKESFAGRAPLYLTHGIMHGNGIICAEGGLWKDQRKLITMWLKSFGMSRHSISRSKLEKRIAFGVNELIKNVKEASGTPIDLTYMLTDSLGNVVNEIIFGYKYPSEDKTWKWFRQIQEEGCHEMGVAGAVNFLPFVRFFSPSTRKTIEILIRGQAQTHRLYAAIVEKRRKVLGVASPEDGECILDNFLLEQKKRFDSGDETAKYMTDEQLLYLLADMFGAGLDTTSVTLAWFLLYMALYPEEQESVRKEILSILVDENDSDYSKLPRLMAAICETQRIRSIVPIGIPHGCTEDTYLGNYRIPKGTMVIPLQWALHMDPNVWENPEEFNPSRFLDKDGNLLKPQEFIPFQTGKRMCPGDELSRMMSCGLIIRLFRHMQVKLAAEPPTEDEMRGTVGVTLSPPKTLFICVPL